MKINLQKQRDILGHLISGGEVTDELVKEAVECGLGAGAFIEWERTKRRLVNPILKDCKRQIEMNKKLASLIPGNEIRDYYNDLNVVAKAEMTIWNDPELVEQYEDVLRDLYVKKCGYDAASYWFMADAATRTEALIRVLEKNK